MAFFFSFSFNFRLAFDFFSPIFFPVVKIYLFALQMFWQFTSHNLCDYFVVSVRDLVCMKKRFQHFFAAFLVLVVSLFNTMFWSQTYTSISFNLHLHLHRRLFVHLVSSSIISYHSPSLSSLAISTFFRYLSVPFPSPSAIVCHAIVYLACHHVCFVLKFSTHPDRISFTF